MVIREEIQLKSKGPAIYDTEKVLFAIFNIKL